MALYEHVFMARPDVSPQQVEVLTEQFKGVIVANGGAVAKTEYWGLKNLAYRLRKNRKAHFTLMNIDAPSAAVVEMERQMRINEDVVRHLTVRVEALEDGPSAMMRKREESERDREGREGRGPRGDRPRRDAASHEEGTA
ncbi:MAG: 30S ribosomal protein S6 [Hyphomicrobiales bacterium]|nr:30S ribosomal protein S6 [Hyphomicrobiales bacterium]MDE2018604.1 30S ribosomal protein S6 [Hyphomicrobiales bacterium]